MKAFTLWLVATITGILIVLNQLSRKIVPTCEVQVLDKIPEQLLKRLEGIGADVAKFKDITTNIEALTKRLEAAEEQQRKFQETVKARSVSLPGVNEQKEKFSWYYAMRKIGGFKLPTKEDKNAAFTEASMEEATKKALDTGSLSTGGAVIAAEHVNEIIDILRPQVAAVKLGAMMEQFSGMPVEIPRLGATATAYWTGENAAITESQQSFEMVELTPHELAALVKMSRRSTNLSNPGLEAIARQDIAKLFARAVDKAIFMGTGADGQPLGIINTTDVNDFTNGWTVSATIDYDGLVNMIGMVEDDDGLGTKMGWAMHPKVKRAIQKLKATDGRPIFNWDPRTSPSGISFEPSILTYPFATSTQLPSGSTAGLLVFGDFSQVIVGQWGSMVLEASTEADTAFAAHQLWVKGVMEVDVALRQPKSFVFEDGITA